MWHKCQLLLQQLQLYIFQRRTRYVLVTIQFSHPRRRPNRKDCRFGIDYSMEGNKETTGGWRVFGWTRQSDLLQNPWMFHKNTRQITIYSVDHLQWSRLSCLFRYMYVQEEPYHTVTPPGKHYLYLALHKNQESTCPEGSRPCHGDQIQINLGNLSLG